MATWDWRILARRVAEVQRGRGPKPLAHYDLFLIQHVLDDLLELVKAFIELGASPEAITVVGIPYSSRNDAAHALESLGCRVRLPQSFPFDAAVGVLLAEAARASQHAGKKLIILEDGGYAVPAVSQLADLGQIDPQVIIGAVEQTSRGSRIDRQLQASKHLRIPVISVPDCNAKKEIEPPYIAEAVDRNLSAVLRNLGGASPQTVGIYGFGVIGNRIALHLQRRGAHVLISDISTDRAYEATLRREFEILRPEDIARCDLLIGNTGRMSIGLVQMRNLRAGAMLVSSSSRQVEIDVEWLYENASPTLTGPSGPCVSPIPLYREFTYRDGSRSVVLLYDGYPINFSGRSLPDHVGDAILALLLEGVVQLPSLTRTPLVYPGNEVLKDPDLEISVMWKREKPNDGMDPWPRAPDAGP